MPRPKHELKSSTNFLISLSRDEIRTLETGDYTEVEAVIENIISRAKSKGYGGDTECHT